MKQTFHGGDIETYREQYGMEPLDYSANGNPLGLSPLARQAVIAALPTAHQYPDPHCRALRHAIARQEGVPPEQILCGNGAADLIYRLVFATKPKTALLLSPTFSEYAHAHELAGCHIRYYPLSEANQFCLTKEIIPHIQADVEMLFLCEPNNPTGMVSAPDVLADIAERCRETGTLLVVDECFNGFLSRPEEHSVKPYLSNLPNLVILKAFTKLYGMAGLRLGYILSSHPTLLQQVAASGQAWPVSSLAQAAGIAALEDGEYLRQARQLIQQERDRLETALGSLGCRVYPSQANYLFFYCDHTDLYTRMAQRGILIRDCSNYRGLHPGYYRIAVGKREANSRLLEALGETLESSKATQI